MCEEVRDRLAAREGRSRGATPWCCGPRATGRSAPASTPRSRTASPTTSGTTRTPASCSAPSGSRSGSRSCARCRASAPPARSTSSTSPTSSICSPEATFFDSHVTYGMVSALEPVGLMRKVGLAHTLRMALIGQRRAGHAPRPRCSIGLVTEVVERDRALGAGPRDRRRHRRQAERGDPGHGARHLGVARPALPGGDGAGPHLHPGRQPDRHGRGGRAPAARGRSRGSDDRVGRRRPRRPASPTSWPSTRRPTRSSSRARGARGASWPTRRTQVAALVDRAGHRGRRPAAQPARRRSALLLGVLPAGGCVVTINPGRGRDRTRDDIAALDLAGARRRARRPRRAACPTGARSTTVAVTDLGEPIAVTPGRPAPSPAAAGPAIAVRMLTSGTTGPPKRIDLSYETLERVLVGRQALRVEPRRRAAAAPPGRRGGQLAARPPRRAVPGAAVRHRRPVVRPARAVHRRRLGRRGPPPPPGHRQPRADRAAHGARRRPRPRRPQQPALGDLRHRAARPRRRRRLLRDATASRC